VDMKCVSDRQDLTQPATGDTSASPAAATAPAAPTSASPSAPNGGDSGQLLGEQWCRAALLKDRTRRAIFERHEAGESVTDLAADYDVPWEFVESLVAWQMFREHDDWKARAHKVEAALAASEARQQALKAELAELNTLADTYATKHGGYVGNAKGVLLALLERDERAKGDR
jgi:hypothetical protein